MRLSALGDVVNCLPLLPLLRDRYPRAKLAFLTAGPNAPLLRTDPLIDTVLVHDRTPNPLARLAMGLRLRGRFDLLVDFQGARYSRQLAWLSGIPTRLGNKPGPAYTHPTPASRFAPTTVDRYREILRPLGLADRTVQPRFPALAAARAAAAPLLAEAGLEPGGYVLLCPGHSPAWPTKRWPAGHWAALAQRFARDTPWHPVLVGAAVDRPLTAEIAGLAGAAATDLAGRTDLPVLGGVAAGARLAVGTDSGPIHVAAMAGAPVIALFGPTDPDRNAPHGDAVVRLTNPVFCSPCFLKRCPYAHQCLDDLPVDRVWQAVTDLLSRTRAGG